MSASISANHVATVLLACAVCCSGGAYQEFCAAVFLQYKISVKKKDRQTCKREQDLFCKVFSSLKTCRVSMCACLTC